VLLSFLVTQFFSVNMPKLKTTDVYQKVAERTAMQKKDIERIIEALLDLITTEMKKGTEVVFTGFGSFLAKERKSRAGFNPKTKQRMHVESVTIAKFKAGKNLKEALKGTLPDQKQPQALTPMQ